MNYWLEYAIRRIPPNAKTVLDVGVGHGEPAAHLTVVRDPEHVVGIEWFEPYAKRPIRMYDEILIGDANRILPTLPSKSFDVVMAFEVIEHQEREQALRMIEECERIGKFVLVSSPNRFYRGHEAHGNRMQLHHSVIHSWEMRRRGYTVRGVNFARVFPIWTFTRHIPDLNTAWLAWKEIPCTSSST